MNSSKDVVFAITEEVGRDITYVRQKSGEEGAFYFTGIEIGVLFGGSVLVTFLIGTLKGLTEEPTKAAGKELGKAVAQQIIKGLDAIAAEAQYKETDTERLLELAGQQQQELDAIRMDLANKLETGDLGRLVRTPIIYERERKEIEAYLLQNGFPQRKAVTHSERLAHTIQQEVLDRE
jgi:hypothetical protein